MSDLWTYSSSAANQIGGSFKAFLYTSTYASPYPDKSKWFQITLPEIQTAVTVQVVQLCNTVNVQKRMGASYICATETSAEPDLTSKNCHPLPFPSGGWIGDFTLTGKHFWLWRDGPGGNDRYSIHEWFLSQVPN